MHTAGCKLHLPAEGLPLGDCTLLAEPHCDDLRKTETQSGGSVLTGFCHGLVDWLPSMYGLTSLLSLVDWLPSKKQTNLKQLNFLCVWSLLPVFMI